MVTVTQNVADGQLSRGLIGGRFVRRTNLRAHYSRFIPLKPQIHLALAFRGQHLHVFGLQN